MSKASTLRRLVPRCGTRRRTYSRALIRIGDEYLAGGEGQVPSLSADPDTALRLSADEAAEVARELRDLGYDAELVQLGKGSR